MSRCGELNVNPLLPAPDAYVDEPQCAAVHGTCIPIYSAPRKRASRGRSWPLSELSATVPEDVYKPN